MTKQCPSCGVEALSVSQGKREVSVPFGPKVSFVVETATCSSCKAVLDLNPDNDERVAAALKESAEASVPVMLSRLEEAGLRNAYVERALGLPQRTIARWKRGEHSAAMFALLRLLCTYPWLVEVADENFSEIEADRAVIRAFDHAASRLRSLSLPSVVSATATAGSYPARDAWAGQVATGQVPSVQATVTATGFTEHAVQ